MVEPDASRSRHVAFLKQSCGFSTHGGRALGTSVDKKPSVAEVRRAGDLSFCRRYGHG
jgi:hypothetical protein